MCVRGTHERQRDFSRTVLGLRSIRPQVCRAWDATLKSVTLAGTR